MKESNKSKNNKKKSRSHVVKNIDDEDWAALASLRAEHNKMFPKNKVSWRVFLKLCNTYSPLVASLFMLDPNDNPTQQLGVNTALTLTPMWVHNIADNLDRIKSEHDISELRNIYKNKPALVVGAGPSLYDNASGTPNQLELIKEYSNGFSGPVIVVDRIIRECLELGVGDYFTLVDGSEKIFKFFDNKTVRNPEYSHNMKAIMATCANKKVVDSWFGDIYFFVSSIPQEVLPNATALMRDFTGTSEINAGGNCGTAGWNLAAHMGCNVIGVCGLDFSYKVTTPIEETQSYNNFYKSLGDKEKVKELFSEGFHPYFKTPYRIDPIYESFRDVFLVWAKAFRERGTCETLNCTEGGAIHGKGVESMYLKEFLEKYSK